MNVLVFTTFIAAGSFAAGFLGAHRSGRRRRYRAHARSLRHRHSLRHRRLARFRHRHLIRCRRVLCARRLCQHPHRHAPRDRHHRRRAHRCHHRRHGPGAQERSGARFWSDADGLRISHEPHTSRRHLQRACRSACQSTPPRRNDANSGRADFLSRPPGAPGVRVDVFRRRTLGAAWHRFGSAEGPGDGPGHVHPFQGLDHDQQFHDRRHRCRQRGGVPQPWLHRSWPGAARGAGCPARLGRRRGCSCSSTRPFFAGSSVPSSCYWPCR